MSPDATPRLNGFLSLAKSTVQKVAPPGLVGQAEKVVQAAQHALSPLPVPDRPDGLTDAEAGAPSDKPHEVQFLQTLVRQLEHKSLATDIGTVVQVGRSAFGPLDDRELLLEHLVAMLQGLPANSTLSRGATDQFSKLLYDDLPHPPAGFVGPSKFRSADGGGNNPFMPDLGRAGQPYARSVPPIHPKPVNLPDPGVVFDALLKRDKFVPHPSGVSSLLFAFATLIVHTIFSTSRTDPTINQTSSYLDLSPLYGRNQLEQDRIRDRSVGLGQIYADTISLDTLYLMPPQVVAFLVVFARNHNSIAKSLFAINESAKFKSPDSLSRDVPEGKTKSAFVSQDDDLFETARLINCGWFINIIFQDYIKAILNLNKTKTEWSLIPLGVIRNFPSGNVPRGTGNAVSVEFNLLYRWHCCISQKDEAWICGVFESILGKDKSPDDYTRADFIRVLGTLQDRAGPDERKWEIPGIHRGEDGKYRDEDLVDLLSEATEEVAGAYKARGIPAVMRIVEEMGIKASRDDWAVCSLNEFRKFLNLTPFKEFKDWNSDPEIAAIAEKLYGHPDNIELHAGLCAEQPKPSMVPGSGLCPGYTISRAILSDAVALTRADRHCTTDFNASALTEWGFEQVQPDTNTGAYGGILGGLLMRTFPDFYAFNSSYALYAYSTPQTQKEFLTALDIDRDYNFDRPERKPAKRTIRSYAGAAAVLKAVENFAPAVGPTKAVIDALAKEDAFFDYFTGSFKRPTFALERGIVQKALQPDGWDHTLDRVCATATTQLLEQASWTYDSGKNYNVDIVRDVVQMVGIEWAADRLGLPIKSKAVPHGISARDLYSALSDLYAFVHLSLPVHDQFKARAKALAAAKKVRTYLVAVLKMFSEQLSIANVTRSLLEKFHLPTVDGLTFTDSAKSVYAELLKTRQPIESLSAVLLAILVETVVPVAQDVANVLSHVLTPSSKAELASMTNLANGPESAKSNSDLLEFIYESLRMSPPLPSLSRVCVRSTTIRDGEAGEVGFAVGEVAVLDLVAVNTDPSAVTNPQQVSISRGFKVAPVLPSTLHSPFAAKVNDVAMTAIVRTILRLPNLRAAAGKAGNLNRVQLPDVALAEAPTFMSPTGVLVPTPVSLGVVYGQ